MISACALLCPSTSSLRSLSLSSLLQKRIPLLSATLLPLSSPPLIRSLRSALPVPLAPSVRRFSRRLPSFSSFVRPSFAFPFLSSRLSLSFSSEDSDFTPASLLPSHQARLCLSLSLLPSPACRSVSPPFDTRRSLFARVTHRRGETIRRFPGWHLVSRAAFFLSISPVSFPCRLSS